jgi:DNA repair protein SbcC/Rad50
MIESLEIENFQNWKKAELHFSPGFNLIIGESNHGKSAIMRALELVATNRPLGNAYINWDGSKDPMTIVLNKNGASIARIKGENIDEYWMDDIDYKALRGGVPQDIQNFLNLGPINIHRQKEGFFLFDKSAGEVGKYLNKIVELDIIDSSLKHAGDRVKEKTKAKEWVEKDIENCKFWLKENAWVVQASKKLTVVEGLEETRNSKSKRRKILTKYYKDYDYHEKKLIQLEPLKNCKIRIERIIKLYDSKSIAEKDTKKIKELVIKAEAIKKEIETTEKLAGLKIRILVLIEKDKQAQQMQDKADNLYSLMSEHVQKKEALNQALKQAKKLKAKFKKLMPNKCPLCGDLKQEVK